MGRWTDARSRDREPGLLAGIAVIVLSGLALGVAYNAVVRAGRPGKGLAWIAEDRVAAMPSLAVVAADGARPDDGNPYATTVDDPMAIPSAGASAGALPEIPDLGRPIQIDLRALKSYYDAGGVTIVDARDAEEFEEGHIAGAVNLPYDQVVTDPARLEAFPAGDKPIVTYCGGGTCELSLSLAEELIYSGHRRVLVFMDGFPAWTEAGYPVARGANRG